MAKERFEKFKIEGQELSIIFMEMIDVKEGVKCETYQFSDDDLKDLAVIYVESGNKTPLQRVLNGQKTVQGFCTGKGTFTLTKENGEKEMFEVNDESGKEFYKEIKVGEIMQWQAAPDSDLVVYEVYYPPYQDGRYEDLDEQLENK